MVPTITAHTVWLSFLVLGCPKSRVQLDERMTTALEAVDAAWRVRADNGFAPVEEALRLAREVDASHPGVAWRAARLGVSRGLMEAERPARLRAYGDARDAAWACVLEDDQVAGLRVEVGLEVALADLSVARRPCASWAAMAWTRWSADYGMAAASLDRPRIEALIGAPTAGSDDRLLQQWASTLLAAHARDAEVRTEGRNLLSALAREPGDPTEGVALVDLYRWYDRGTEREERTLALLNAKSPPSVEARAYGSRVRDRR
jgi:hypothetical protein